MGKHKHNTSDATTNHMLKAVACMQRDVAKCKVIGEDSRAEAIWGMIVSLERGIMSYRAYKDLKIRMVSEKEERKRAFKETQMKARRHGR